ncbi:glycosyltransferase [Caulobacter sp. BK020]|uniref:glycosyltransferase n=1 Tax=Caulobacter sp. BK020 TaxID=2512117 RepID=UPI0010E3EC57|nr:glycosyltransferase [Caulobacter sp. BK020]TCS12478.1 UDP-N-acetylglucosamine transferase subunit ALG13 [Caulobacter sp. BK020]
MLRIGHLILLSVGTQLPFDRLVRAVDDWAIAAGRTDVVAQVGPSTYAPRSLKAFPFLAPEAFRELQLNATIMISHAGMGSILTALEYGKPIIIMPRDHLRGEHRNGHQMATAERFKAVPGIYVASDEHGLIEHLTRLTELTGSQKLPPHAPASFTDRLRDFILRP